MKTSGQIKEEMIRRLNTIIWERFRGHEIYKTGTYKKLREEKEFWEYVSSLISHHGGGGPRVKADAVRRMIQDASEEAAGEGLVYRTIFDWLRSIGVEVEEQGKEKA